jgi:hypothetical protein
MLALGLTFIHIKVPNKKVLMVEHDTWPHVESLIFQERNSFKKKKSLCQKNKFHIFKKIGFICVWKKTPFLQNDFSIFSKNKNFQSQFKSYIVCQICLHTSTQYFALMSYFFPKCIHFIRAQTKPHTHSHTKDYKGFINISTLLLLLSDQNLIWFHYASSNLSFLFFLLARQGEVGLVFQENKSFMM